MEMYFGGLCLALLAAALTADSLLRVRLVGWRRYASRLPWPMEEEVRTIFWGGKVELDEDKEDDEDDELEEDERVCLVPDCEDT